VASLRLVHATHSLSWVACATSRTSRPQLQALPVVTLFLSACALPEVWFEFFSVMMLACMLSSKPQPQRGHVFELQCAYWA
jgi:hypothetical protein